MKTRLWLAWLALCGSALAGERWQLVYAYEPPDNSDFVIADLEFASPQRGMAAGAVMARGKLRPYAVATADGGRTWTPVRIPETPLSLYFLNENAGWLVGRDIWRTSDFGATWKKLTGAPRAERVWFSTETHGYAVGSRKSAYETFDGGNSWKPLAVAAQPKTSPENTVYSSIAFADANIGMIGGWSKPPRAGDHGRPPDWMEPESRRRELPAVTILLQTKDGGQSWHFSESSLFGQITRIALAGDGRGLGLFEFFDRFDYPSEVYRFDLRTSQSQRSFRKQDRAVTDVVMAAGGPAYLAAIEPTGRLQRSPIPGKVKILKSNDLVEWTEMEVDYRAVGRRALLAVSGERAWAATDTGMILALAAQ